MHIILLIIGAIVAIVLSLYIIHKIDKNSECTVATQVESEQLKKLVKTEVEIISQYVAAPIDSEVPIETAIAEVNKTIDSLISNSYTAQSYGEELSYDRNRRKKTKKRNRAAI